MQKTAFPARHSVDRHIVRQSAAADDGMFLWGARFFIASSIITNTQMRMTKSCKLLSFLCVLISSLVNRLFFFKKKKWNGRLYYTQRMPLHSEWCWKWCFSPKGLEVSLSHHLVIDIIIVKEYAQPWLVFEKRKKNVARSILGMIVSLLP